MSDLHLLAKLATEKLFERRTGSPIKYRDRLDRRLIFGEILAEEIEKRRPELERIERKNKRRSRMAE